MPQPKDKPAYPFTAVVGQPYFKLALTLTAIHPAIGGVLVSGPRGSAKSTLARALADILPPVSNSPNQFITLPLSASDEMVTGTLDLQQVLNEQKVEFKPGLLAKAHQGVLYVDEVNLLNDALVDLLLDVAASGINCVERDGISYQHAAVFILLGTMNPDEGELRPQLHDRFGLAVDLSSRYSLEDRVEIVRRREAFDLNAEHFCKQYEIEQQALLQSVVAARDLLEQVSCSDELRLEIAQRCEQANVDGLRADIVWFRAATAHTALHRRTEVMLDDINAVEDLVLAHRRQNSDNSNQSPPSGSSDTSSSEPSLKGKPFQRPAESLLSDQDENKDQGQWGSMAPQAQDTQAIQKIDLNQSNRIQSQNAKSPKDLCASKVKGQAQGGSYQSEVLSPAPNWFGTLAMNAGQWPPKKLVYRKLKGGQKILNFVLLDTSASTLGSQLLAKAKGVVLQIANQAYLSREQLTILGFGNDKLDTILPRVRAPKQIRKTLDTVNAGGGTPIRDALTNAQLYLQTLLRAMPELVVKCYLITDGRSKQKVNDIALPGECTVIDIESSTVKRGRAQQIAQELGASYMTLSGISTLASGPTV